MANEPKGGTGPAAREPLPTKRTCAVMEVHHRLLRTVPRYAEARERIEESAFRAENLMTAQRTGCTMIPVVVHVVHRNDAENISVAQVESQIRVLNEDFRKKNADVEGVPAAFAPLAADARIMFELATTDPAGNPTDGITRTRTSAGGFNQDDGVKSAGTGGADAWPASQYLNIWVCHLTGGLLGYAQFPGGPADTDGVVILNTAFGTTGTAAAPFNLGRTATHEIGHWLNLRHIWGDDGDGCGGSDFVADTPNQGGSNTGTPTFPRVTCSNGPNGDMFMNYMDYTDDVGMFMFTAGQVVRMQAALDGPRSTVGRSVACGGTIKNPKELTKEFPKDPVKERPKEFVKEPVKEPAKDPPKDNPKEFSKDTPKDGIKDPPKDNPKDFTKDTPKDGIKDRPKDLIKDRPKELVFDPPKPFLENPKGIFEQPGGFPNLPGQPGPGFGGLQPQPVAGGAVPFTLGGRGGQSAFAQQAGAAPGGQDDAARLQLLHSAYMQILQALQALGSAGLLDEQGQALAQQLLSNYQQLASGQA